MSSNGRTIQFQLTISSEDDLLKFLTAACRSYVGMNGLSSAYQQPQIISSDYQQAHIAGNQIASLGKGGVAAKTISAPILEGNIACVTKDKQHWYVKFDPERITVGAEVMEFQKQLDAKFSTNRRNESNGWKKLKELATALKPEQGGQLREDRVNALVTKSELFAKNQAAVDLLSVVDNRIIFFIVAHLIYLSNWQTGWMVNTHSEGPPIHMVRIPQGCDELNEVYEYFKNENNRWKKRIGGLCVRASENDPPIDKSEWSPVLSDLLKNLDDILQKEQGCGMPFAIRPEQELQLIPPADFDEFPPKTISAPILEGNIACVTKDKQHWYVKFDPELEPVGAKVMEFQKQLDAKFGTRRNESNGWKKLKELAAAIKPKPGGQLHEDRVNVLVTKSKLFTNSDAAMNLLSVAYNRRMFFSFAHLIYLSRWRTDWPVKSSNPEGKMHMALVAKGKKELAQVDKLFNNKQDESKKRSGGFNRNSKPQKPTLPIDKSKWNDVLLDLVKNLNDILKEEQGWGVPFATKSEQKLQWMTPADFKEYFGDKLLSEFQLKPFNEREGTFDWNHFGKRFVGVRFGPDFNDFFNKLRSAREESIPVEAPNEQEKIWDDLLNAWFPPGLANKYLSDTNSGWTELEASWNNLKGKQDATVGEIWDFAVNLEKCKFNKIQDFSTKFYIQTFKFKGNRKYFEVLNQAYKEKKFWDAIVDESEYNEVVKKKIATLEKIHPEFVDGIRTSLEKTANSATKFQKLKRNMLIRELLCSHSGWRFFDEGQIKGAAIEEELLEDCYKHLFQQEKESPQMQDSIYSSVDDISNSQGEPVSNSNTEIPSIRELIRLDDIQFDESQLDPNVIGLEEREQLKRKQTDEEIDAFFLKLDQEIN